MPFSCMNCMLPLATIQANQIAAIMVVMFKGEACLVKGKLVKLERCKDP